MANNEDREHRQKVIRELLSDLHAGKSFEEVKARFQEAFDGVSASEIADAERGLIDKGLPVEEITRLCDVHAAVFRGSVEEIHRPANPREIKGHPAHTLQAENRALENLIDERIKPHLDQFLNGEGSRADILAAASSLAEDLKALSEIDAHYVRKEHLFFPYMEKHGITAPPKVMWAVDDEIRDMVKEAARMLQVWMEAAEGVHGSGDTTEGLPSREAIGAKMGEALAKIADMILKEDDILLPMVLDVFTAEEWNSIADESPEIGYFLIPPPPKWRPLSSWLTGQGPVSVPPAKPAPVPDGEQRSGPSAGTAPASDTTTVKLPTGTLKVEELLGILNTLPFDITFIDKDDVTRYFSQGSERIFPRTKAVIGRRVVDCHPPASVHIVQGIVDSFRSGEKDHEDFWLKLKDKYVFIRYFAVRGDDGSYLGTVEVTQDIKPIQAIQGEKRLVQGN